MARPRWISRFRQSPRLSKNRHLLDRRHHFGPQNLLGRLRKDCSALARQRCEFRKNGGPINQHACTWATTHDCLEHTLSYNGL
jgi:hypothetical protein